MGDPNHRYKHSCGYIKLYRPDHPFCDCNGTVPEHRLVLEEKLGFHIDSRKYHVHHIDGVKDNNKLENLQLVTPLQHHRIEKGWKEIDGIWFKPCYICKKMFSNTPDNFYFRKKGILAGRSLGACIPCSLEAIKKGRLKNVRIKVDCQYCGKTTVIKAYRRNQKFCNRECSRLGQSYNRTK